MKVAINLNIKAYMDYGQYEPIVVILTSKNGDVKKYVFSIYFDHIFNSYTTNGLQLSNKYDLLTKNEKLSKIT